LAFLFPIAAFAGEIIPAGPVSNQSLALARYLMATQEGNLFQSPQPVVVEVEAAIPGLYKESRVVTLRRRGEDGHVEYRLLLSAGDATVLQEVIAPFLTMEDAIEELPQASVAVTPVNYRFRYLREVGSGAAAAYVYRVTPKKKRSGLIEGELWIDANTGVGVLETGHLVKTPSGFAPRIQLVRDTKLRDGVPFARVTHAAIETRSAGRGELTITELRVPANAEEAPSPAYGVGAWVSGAANFTAASR
jgi:hypothetical protein